MMYSKYNEKNDILIAENSGGTFEHEHVAEILTFGIKSKGDYERYRNSLDKNYDNLPDSFTPYCFNAKTGKIYNLFEFEAMMGFA